MDGASEPTGCMSLNTSCWGGEGEGEGEGAGSLHSLLLWVSWELLVSHCLMQDAVPDGTFLGLMQ